MRAKTILFYGLAALMAGCLPVFSLHPLARPDNLTFDERLIGVWDDDGKTTWEFSKATPADANGLPDGLDAAAGKLYRLQFRENGRAAGDFIACLVKLGDHLVLDVFPKAFPSGRTDVETMNLPYNGLFFIRAHTFIRVDDIGDKVKLQRTDDEAFEKFTKDEPNAIAFTRVDDRVVITASAADVRAFVSKYIGDDEFFTNAITLTRQKQN